MRTLYNRSVVREALVSATRTNGTANGVAIDLGIFANDFRTVMFVVTTATITDGTHAITVEESADGSTGWTAVAASRVQGTLPSITSANDDTFFYFGVIVETLQYLRAVATTSGATTGGVFSIKAILADGGMNPPARS